MDDNGKQPIAAKADTPPTGGIKRTTDQVWCAPPIVANVPRRLEALQSKYLRERGLKLSKSRIAASCLIRGIELDEKEG